MPNFGEPTYGTTEWLQFPNQRGRRDLLRFLCLWHGIDKKDFGKAPTEHDMLDAMVKRRRQSSGSSSSASQPADPMPVLTTVVDKIKHAMDDAPCEVPRLPSAAIQSLANLVEVHAHNSQLAGVRRMLIKIVTEMTKEAEKVQLDLRPYMGDIACCVFLFWCITTGRHSRAA